MKLEHLKYFINLAQTNSITKSSLQLYTTQQNLSKIINQLEDELDTTLFLRSHKGLSLTPSGEIFYTFARNTLAAYVACTADIKNISSYETICGDVDLYFSSFCQEYISNFIIYFAKNYPRVHINTLESNPFDIL